MPTRHLLLSLAVVTLTAAGCASRDAAEAAESSDALVGQAPASLSIAAISATSFDGTSTSEGGSARAHVEYTATTTFFEITTSRGTVVVRTGTASGNGVEPAVLQAGDLDRPLVARLLADLLVTGASPTPSDPGATIYAAAYFAARALGQVTPGQRGAPRTDGVWPYPGFRAKAKVPSALRDPSKPYAGHMSCCGPYTCSDADWDPNLACDDWCAAGDACNAWGWGDCGTAMFFPKGGCNACPHSNSPTILATDPAGCNDGTCNPRCFGDNPTHNGPASNFCNYGRVFYGAVGGERGTGADDHWF